MAGRSVLLIDLDPQANATSGLGLDVRKQRQTIYDCLTRGAKAKDTIQLTAIAQLSILPSSPDLAAAEVELVEVEHRETVLGGCLHDLTGAFEIALIDCPPTLGLLTINGLVAATSVLVPVQCEYYAMEGLGRLMATIQRVQASLNPGLELEGILLTMFDVRNTLSKQVAEEIRGHFKQKVYQSIIPRNVALAEAPSYGRPVLLYNAGSSGAHAYLELAKEFLTHA